MGKKSKRKPQVAPPNDILKTVEEIYAICSKDIPRDSWPEFEPLYSLLNKLESLQDAQLHRDTSISRLQYVGAFEKWLDDHRIDHGSVKIVESPVGAGLGLQAACELQQGQPFITIPANAMMLASQAMEGNLGLLVSRDPLLQAMPNLSLALLLLNECFTSQSKWRPYIDLLPMDYSTPQYFTKEDFQLMNGSPTQKECIKQMWNIAKLYSHLFLLSSKCPTVTSCLPMFQSGFCYRDFCWAVSSVTTRQNKIPVKGNDGSHDLALIPLWDMCNHVEGEISTDYNPVMQQCVCYAAHTVAAGDEVCIYYGPRSNAELLLHSGFVYPNNQRDYLKIRLGLSQSEERETREIRKAILQDLELPITGEYKIHYGEHPINQDLLAFIRVFSASKELLTELNSLTKEERKSKLCTCDKLEISDNKAFEFLQKRCELLLMVYKRSAEEDAKFLESTASVTTKHILALCICEKNLLKSTVHYCKDKISHNQVV